MKNEIKIKNLLAFIKRNRKSILVTSGSVALVFLIGSIMSLFLVDNDTEAPTRDESIDLEVEEFKKVPYEELTSQEQDLYLDYLSQEAYYFRFYVEHEDYDAFTAPYLLEEILLRKEVIEYIESNAGVEFAIDPEVALTVTKADNSVIHELQVGTGNRLDNLRLSNAFMGALDEGITPFVENKRFYFISDQPILREVETGEGFIDQIEISDNNNIVYIVIMILSGLFIGFVLGILISLMRMSFSKETHELYEFVLQPSDIFIDFSSNSLQDDYQNNQKLLHAILYPSEKKKIILNDYSTNSIVLDKLINLDYLRKSNIELKNNVTELDSSIEYDEVVILVIRNITTKEWYESQRMQLRNYPSIIKIINC